jgi:hypothetical protein
MPAFSFSIGRNTFDNAPTQLTAADFDDFIAKISNTRSKRKGEFYICSPLKSGVHDDPSKFAGLNNWRLKRLALPRQFLALDVDFFKSPADFVAFKQHVGQWNALVYTTASHTPQAPRARAIIELDQPVDSKTGEDLGDALQRSIESVIGISNIKLDPCVYLASQPIYTPLVSSQTYRTNGHPLDVQATLTAWPAPNAQSSSGLQIPGNLPSMSLSPVMAALVLPPETMAEIAKVSLALSQVSADCSYNEWRDILFALHWTQWVCAEQLAKSWSMTAPHRYDPTAFDNVWQHAKPLGQVTLGTLFHLAKLNGAANIASPHSAIQGHVTKSAIASHSIVGLASGRMTLRSTPPPPRNYVLGNVVVPASVAVMAGVGGTAKTTLAIQFSIHGALGKKLGTIQVGKFSSMLFLGEETDDERDRRFGALSVGLSVVDRTTIEKNVYCHGAAGDDLRLTFMMDGNVQESGLVDQIIGLAKQHANQADYPVGLIVLDHARLVMAGDPLSADHVTALLRALTRIAVETGAAVLLLAHSPKSTYSKDGEADPSEVFGSGAFVDHTRSAFVLHVMREKEAKHFGMSDIERKEHVSLNVVKANYGPSGTSWWFKKVAVSGWQAIELEPVFLLPKSQMATMSLLSRKITDLIKDNPGRITERALRDKYAGQSGKLAASEAEVKRTLHRLLDEGNLIRRPPTDEERKLHRLSHNVKEVLGLPEMAA